MFSQLESHLNKEQFKAVTNIEGPLQILAGAGSGKTRVITYRIAYMLSKGISQSSILALTFTNKAAREMEKRVKSLTGKKLNNLTISTFHAFGVKILHKQINTLGYKSNFSIYDQTDKIALIKELSRELKSSAEKTDLYSIGNLFSQIKTGQTSWNETNIQYKEMYRKYQDHIEVYNAVDFDDLIVLPIKIFNNFPDVLDEYHSKYKYIMVDEFQDTSKIQYTLIKKLSNKLKNICVVGDDDQSIYSWRGANYQNIINFEKDFKGFTEIKLEQNYRSTKNILSAANSLITNNKIRKDKNLWTGLETGKSIELYYPDNEHKEGLFISDMIKSISIQEGIKYHNIGVLVRTNNLTASIEEMFLEKNIPYKVSGGMSFFQRKEIKDIISYLKVLANPDDDINLLRIINMPRRGIGKQTILNIRNIADKKSCSLYSAICLLLHSEDALLSVNAKSKLEDFITLIDDLRQKILTGRDMAETVKNLIEMIEYYGYLMLEHKNSLNIAKWKYGNIIRFISMIESWEKNPDTIEPTIFKYLNRISLITQEESSDSEDNKVNLMTIHAAKGLEFNTVFLPGVENNIIPHFRALNDNKENIEEERRLFYVAITRAKRKLFITSCKQRKIMRETTECTPSPFLLEIPENLIKYHEEEKVLSPEEFEKCFSKMKMNYKFTKKAPV